MKKTMQLWALAGFLAGLFCLDNIQLANAQNNLTKDTPSIQDERTFLDIDVLVYQYRPNTDGKDTALASLVQRLKERQVPLPLIVYIAAGQRMDADGEKLLQKYRWFIYANMPLTLLGHIYNAVNVFHATNANVQSEEG